MTTEEAIAQLEQALGERDAEIASLTLNLQAQATTYGDQLNAAGAQAQREATAFNARIAELEAQVSAAGIEALTAERDAALAKLAAIDAVQHPATPE